MGRRVKSQCLEKQYEKPIEGPNGVEAAMLVYLKADFGMLLCYNILHAVMSFLFGAQVMCSSISLCSYI